jgi:hypothetical protein
MKDRMMDNVWNCDSCRENGWLVMNWKVITVAVIA